MISDHGLVRPLSAWFPTLTDQVTLGFEAGRARAWLHEEGVVEAERQTDDGYDLTVRWTERQRARFFRL